MSDALHDRLASALAAHGTRVLFGLPGGGPNLDVVGAADRLGLRFVLAHTETAAAIMAATNGLLSGSPGAIVVTRGPGAASAVNGIAQATLDRFPLVAVTDTVPAAMAGRIPHQRLDQRTMLGPTVKESATITDAMSDPVLDDLVAATTDWPFGAVHLDYDPGSTATSTAPTVASGSVTPEPEGRATTVPSAEARDRARELVQASRRPIVLAGFEAAATAPELGPHLEAFGAPVFTTYQAIGLVPSEGPVSAGLFTNGATEAKMLAGADLIITVGLDPVEPIPAPWPYSADVIRISARPDVETEPYLRATIDLIGDLGAITAELLGAGHPELGWQPDAGARHRATTRDRLAATPAPEPSGFGPLQLVDTLVRHHEHLGTVTVDAGAHFLAIMPFWPVAEPLRLLISNGLATMGFALPAAIGAAVARPDEPVLALTGDGGLSMVLGELETLARLELPVTVVVFNDAALSLIEIKQQPDHGGADAVRFAAVDYAAVARGFGIDGVVVGDVESLEAVLAEGGSGGWQRPRLIDARIDPAAYPHLIEVTRG